MLPGLSSACYIYSGRLHTNIIASITPKSTQKETERTRAKGKKGRRRKRQKRLKGKIGSARTSTMAAVFTATVPAGATSPFEGDGAGGPEKKTDTQSNRRRLRLRRRYVPISRCDSLLSCLPSPSCFLQPRFPYPPARLFGFERHASGLRGTASPLCSPFTCHLSMNRSAASRIPQHHLAAFNAAWTYSTVSSPNCRMDSSVGPSVNRRTARSFLGVLSQLFGGPPRPGFFPPAICATIIRLGARPFFAAPLPQRRRAVVFG